MHRTNRTARLCLTVTAAAAATALSALTLIPPASAATADIAVATQHSPTVLDPSWQGQVTDLDTDQDGDTATWLATPSVGGQSAVRVTGSSGHTATFTGTRIEQPTIDDSGTRVAFLARATDSGPRTARLGDVATGATTPAPTPVGTDTVATAIAGDGQHVALVYRDTPTTGSYHLAVWDTASSTIANWTTWATSPLLTLRSSGIAVSDDATTIAYLSAGASDGSGHTRCHPHVVTNRAGAVTDIDAGVDATGAPLEVSCDDVNTGVSQTRPILSGDGTTVAFAAHPTTTQKTGPGATDTNPATNIVYTRNVTTGTTTRISPTPATVGNDPSVNSDALPTGIDDTGATVTWYDLDNGTLDYVDGNSGRSVSANGFLRRTAACAGTCDTTTAGLSRVATTASGKPAWYGLYAATRNTPTMLAISGDGTHTVFAASDPGLTGPDVESTQASGERVYTAAPTTPSVADLGTVTLDETSAATVTVTATGLSGVAKASVFDSTGARVGQANLTVLGAIDQPGTGTGTATIDLYGVTPGTLTVRVLDRSGETATGSGTAKGPGNPEDPGDPDDPTGPTTAPDAVRGLSATAHLGSATLTWNRNEADKTRIIVSGRGFSRTFHVPADRTHATLRHLPVSRTLTVNVQAVNVAGASDPRRVVLYGTRTTVRAPRVVVHHRGRPALARVTAQVRTVLGTPVRGRKVQVQVSRDGRHWRTIRAPKTSSRGYATALVPLPDTRLVRAVFTGAGHNLGDRSPTRRVNVRLAR